MRRTPTFLREKKRPKTKLFENLMEEIKILRGWKEIKEACGLQCSDQTMRRMARKFGMPLFHMDTRPTALEFEIKKWWVLFSEKVMDIEQKEREKVSKAIKG